MPVTYVHHSRTKDFHIIKLIYFAEKKLLDKWHEGVTSMPVQHHERAVIFTDFKVKLFKKLSGMSHLEWLRMYGGVFHDEIRQEYLEYEHGIYSGLYGRDGFWMFIPKTKTDLFEWIKKNYKNPYKVYKRSPCDWMWIGGREENKKDQRYWRDEGIKFAKEQAVKFPNLYKD